jgi:hypothetical protein
LEDLNARTRNRTRTPQAVARAGRKQDQRPKEGPPAKDSALTRAVTTQAVSSPEAGPSRIVRRAPDVEHREWVVIRNPKTGDERTLEGSAWLIWHLLAENPQSLDGLISAAQTLYVGSVDQIALDIEAFVNELAEAGFLIV